MKCASEKATRSRWWPSSCTTTSHAPTSSPARMSEFRDQCRNWNAYDFGEEAADGGKGIATTAQSSNQIPIIINNNNL